MKTRKTLFVKMAALVISLTAALQAQDGAAIYASNTNSSKPAAYIFEVRFDSQVTPSSHFEIVFPGAFNVSTAMMAVSEKLDGNLAVTVEKNTVKLRRIGAHSTIAPGDTVDFKIASIINPAQFDQSWVFTIIHSEGRIEVENKVHTQTVQIIK